MSSQHKFWIVINPTKASLLEDLVVTLTLAELSKIPKGACQIADKQKINSVFLSEDEALLKASQLLRKSVGEGLRIEIPKSGSPGLASSDYEQLDQFLTFWNSALSWLSRNYQRVQYFSSFHKACYSSWRESIERKEYEVGSDFKSWDPLYSALTFLKENGNRGFPAIDSEWFYRYFGQEVLRINEASEFSLLMSMRERIFEAFGGLPSPFGDDQSPIVPGSNKVATHTHPLFKRVPLMPDFLANSSLEFEDWNSQALSPHFDALLLAIDTRLYALLAPNLNFAL